MFESTAQLIEFTRWYLAVFFTGVALFYTLRIVYLKHATEKQMVFPGPRFCTTWWNHMAFRVFRVLIWFICVARAFFPEADSFLLMLPTLEKTFLLGCGLLLLSIGFICTISIHLHFLMHFFY